jgi:predicted nucleic acid-binding protein
MGKGYIIDTNVVSKYIRGLYAQATLEYIENILTTQTVCVSFVTQIELLSYNPQTISPEITAYRNSIQVFLTHIPVLLLDESIIAETIRIRKTTRVKLPDCLIGASAMTFGYNLLSSNSIDFDKMKPLGLSLFVPEDMPLSPSL